MNDKNINVPLSKLEDIKETLLQCKSLINRQGNIITNQTEALKEIFELAQSYNNEEIRNIIVRVLRNN